MSTITDSEGYWEFAGVPIGTYRLEVDIAGLTMDLGDSNTIVIVSIDTINDIHIVADSQQVNVVMTQVNDIPEMTSPVHRDLFNVFPNPAPGLLNLQWRQDVKSAVLAVYDAQGRLLRQQTLDQQVAGQIVSIALEDLSEGPYLMQVLVKTEGGEVHAVTRKIMVVKGN